MWIILPLKTVPSKRTRPDSLRIQAYLYQLVSVIMM